MAPASARTRIFSGLGGRYKVVKGSKWAKIGLLSCCRQPPAEIRDFSKHFDFAMPNFYDFRIKTAIDSKLLGVFDYYSLISFDFARVPNGSNP